MYLVVGGGGQGVDPSPLMELVLALVSRGLARGGLGGAWFSERMVTLASSFLTSHSSFWFLRSPSPSQLSWHWGRGGGYSSNPPSCGRSSCTSGTQPAGGICQGGSAAASCRHHMHVELTMRLIDPSLLAGTCNSSGSCSSVGACSSLSASSSTCRLSSSSSRILLTLCSWPPCQQWVFPMPKSPIRCCWPPLLKSPVAGPTFGQALGPGVVPVLHLHPGEDLNVLVRYCLIPVPLQSHRPSQRCQKESYTCISKQSAACQRSG